MPAKPKTKRPQRLFQIHNLVRRVETRTHRQQAASRHRMNLLLGGGIIRVVRGRFATVGESVIHRLLPELVEKEAAGMLMVTDNNGRRIDLRTGDVAENLPPVPPLPAPPLDSAANDKTFEHGVGQHIPQHSGGSAMTQSVDQPAAIRPEIPEGFEEEPELEEEPTNPADALPEGTEQVVETEVVTVVDVTEPEEPADPEPSVDNTTESDEDRVQRIYDSASRAKLEGIAKEMKLDTSGNKRDLAKRLAEAGYKPE